MQIVKLIYFPSAPNISIYKGSKSIINNEGKCWEEDNISQRNLKLTMVIKLEINLI